MCAREKKEKAIAMYDTTQSITEVICRLGYPINRKNGERRYRYQYLFLRYRFFGYLQNNPLNSCSCTGFFNYLMVFQLFD